ncbi:MAG: hypothetical protein RBT49_01055 [Bacteroidales bacterium]|jgi:hypothetical protein|nr:hypothetical protein [Bacteroidales bacterium]
MIVHESGMSFPIVDESLFFHIENSNLYKSIQQGVKVAEFIKLDDQICYIFEAKTTFPNPNNKENGNVLNFDTSIGEIKDKFINTLSIFIANSLKRHGENFYNEMPVPFQTMELDTLNFKFILIIKDHKSDWLTPVNDELKRKIKVFFKSWNIKEHHLKVLNEELAREKGFIS